MKKKLMRIAFLRNYVYLHLKYIFVDRFSYIADSYFKSIL